MEKGHSSLRLIGVDEIITHPGASKERGNLKVIITGPLGGPDLVCRRSNLMKQVSGYRMARDKPCRRM